MPSFADAIIYSAGVLISLGGGSAIVAAASKFAANILVRKFFEEERAKHERVLASFQGQLARELAQYETRLSKSHFLFEKEFEAASELVDVAESMLPERDHPDMDWPVACQEIAQKFESHELALKAFMRRHGAVLDGEARRHLNRAIRIASQGKFGKPEDGDPKEQGDAFFDELQAAKSRLIAVVRGQVST